MIMLTMLTTEPPAARPSIDFSEKYANSSDLSSSWLVASANAAASARKVNIEQFGYPGQ